MDTTTSLLHQPDSSSVETQPIEQALLAQLPKALHERCKSFDALVAHVLAHPGREKEHGLERWAQTLAATGHKRASELAAILIVLKRPDRFSDIELFLSLLPAQWPARLNHLRRALIEYALTHRRSTAYNEIIRRYADAPAAVQEQAAKPDQTSIESAVLAAMPKRLRTQYPSLDALVAHLQQNSRASEPALQRAAQRLATARCKEASQWAAVLVIVAAPDGILGGERFISLLPTELPSRLEHLRSHIVEMAKTHPQSIVYQEVVKRYARAPAGVQVPAAGQERHGSAVAQP